VRLRRRRGFGAGAWLAFAVALLLLAAAPAHAKQLPPAPIKGVCYGEVLLPGQQCYYDPTFVDFSLSDHILHVGDRMTGKYSWQLPREGVATLQQQAPGLSFKGCQGDKDGAVGPDTGKANCIWRATRSIGDWNVSLGTTLSITGSPSYRAGDYYTVVGKDPVIDGEVVTKSVGKGVPKHGIDKAKVRIEGIGKNMPSTSAVTNRNGYYDKILEKPGRYEVTPVLPKGAKEGKHPVKPRSHTVTAREDETTTANFEVEDTLTVKMDLARSSVPASGMEVVQGTVKVTRFGEPLPYATVSMRPFGGGLNPERIPVPAKVCNTSVRLFPQGSRFTASASAEPFDLTMDGNGQYSFQVVTGTVPGRFEMTAWVKDENGKLITQDLAHVTDEASVKVTSLGSASTGTSQAVAKGIADAFNASDVNPETSPIFFVRQFNAYAAAGAPGIAGLQADPVRGEAYPAVLIHNAGDQVKPTAGGTEIDPSSAGLVFPTQNYNPVLPTSFVTVMRDDNFDSPQPLTLATFAKGSGGLSWTLTNQVGKSRIFDDYPTWNFFGFPQTINDPC